MSAMNHGKKETTTRKISRKRDSPKKPLKKDIEKRSAASTNGDDLSGDEHCIEGCKTMTLRLDPGLLDCPICYEPLSPPIFQCPNGHFACSTCTKKLDAGKCPSCSLHACQIRNLGLESVAAGARIRCPFSPYGCRIVVSYSDLIAHETVCPSAPCSCPIPNCDFSCAAPFLGSHIRNNHNADAITHSFTYGRAQTLRIRSDDPFLVLLGNAGGPVFLLVRGAGGRNTPSGGVQVMAICLQPPDSCGKWEYEYKIAVIGDKTALQMTTRAVSTTIWNGDFGDNSFLFVPKQHVDPQNLVELTLQIRKINKSSMHV